METRPLRIVGIAGSLRRGSFNRSLLAAARDLSPESLRIEPFDLREIPLYDQDLDTDDRRPESVRRLKASLEGADGVLIAAPEYNYGITGVLKNALDWASRPAFRSPMLGKRVGIMGASKGGSGTLRAQEQVKLTLLGMAAEPFPGRAVAVQRAPEKFDEDGRLTDEATREFLEDYLVRFERWVRGE